MIPGRLLCSGALLLSMVLQSAAEEVVFYPAYGFRAGAGWAIPIRAKVQEPRAIEERLIDTLLTPMLRPSPHERENFRARIADVVADDESGERVRLAFDGDDGSPIHRLSDENGREPRTDSNGIVEGTIALPDAAARRLMEQQRSTGGWLTYRAVSPRHRGQGRVRLLEPDGVSVISDIDDTIKISEVPAGKRILAQNTFLRDFAAAPGMQARYAALTDAAFHYVSGSPWQLYRPLSRFLIEESRFPEGTFHFKELRGSVLTASRSLEDLANFANPEGTVTHKTDQISRIMTRFPGRPFILIGDSGERDPEVYQEIRRRFGSQVREILIRDVVNARQTDSARLAGMTIIEAPTVLPGVTQLKD